MLRELSKYLEVDREKKELIADILYPTLKCKLESPVFYSKRISKASIDACMMDVIPLTKYCPKCHREYPEEENFCYDCLTGLKHISEIIDVRDINSKQEFKVRGHNVFSGFEDIFTPENIDKINSFDFSIKDYHRIEKRIKRTAFKNFDDLVKSNELVLDYLDILDKILLFSKSFVEVDFKSFGPELGLYTFNRIDIDDRQSKALQITTIIHELSHFLLKEIIAQILCKILDCRKNSYIEAIATFILVHAPFTRLIDEYSAHTVEGRFTMYGYQDYSSFIQIEQTLEGEMSKEEIEITKSIGNTFAISIKRILESYIDRDLREKIKTQFRMDIMDRPNYEMLALENCENLTQEGFLKAIWLILTEGFETASHNISKLTEYEHCFE